MFINLFCFPLVQENLIEIPEIKEEDFINSIIFDNDINKIGCGQNEKSIFISNITTIPSPLIDTILTTTNKNKKEIAKVIKCDQIILNEAQNIPSQTISPLQISDFESNNQNIINRAGNTKQNTIKQPKYIDKQKIANMNIKEKQK